MMSVWRKGGAALGEAGKAEYTEAQMFDRRGVLEISVSPN